MDLADELCNGLFHLIDKQDQCADDCMALAGELEEWRKKMTTGQFVGNTAIIAGSVTLIGTGFFTLMTGGMAAPLMVVVAAGATGTVTGGSVTSITCSLLEKWKSSKTMKKAAKTSDEIQKIQNHITRLQMKLSEECESHDLKASSPDEVQCEITVRLLRAMAKRSGKDLPLSYLRHLLRSDDTYTHKSYEVINPSIHYNDSVSFPQLCEYSSNILLKHAVKELIYTELLSTYVNQKPKPSDWQSVLNGIDQVATGVTGVVFALPNFIKNCEELIKNEHHTEASTYLKKKANEIREAVRQLKKHLNELEEILRRIPEMDCHIDLVQEMLGSQISSSNWRGKQ